MEELIHNIRLPDIPPGINSRLDIKQADTEAVCQQITDHKESDSDFITLRNVVI